MTQHQLIIEYIKQFGKITPATLKEAQRAFKGHWLGSETIRRCQELEVHTIPTVQKYEKLYKKSEGKFKSFYLDPQFHEVKSREESRQIAAEFLKQFPSKQQVVKQTLF